MKARYRVHYETVRDREHIFPRQRANAFFMSSSGERESIPFAYEDRLTKRGAKKAVIRKLKKTYKKMNESKQPRVDYIVIDTGPDTT